MKTSSLLIGGLITLMSSSLYASEMEMGKLMQLLGAHKHTRSEFVERKYVRLLDSPVESSGELIFKAPLKLEKNTKLPRMENMLIEGNMVSIDRGSFKRSMVLEESGGINALVQSLMSTFGGDQAGLEKYFAWTLMGPTNKWRLILKPKASKLFVTLREISLSGDNGYIHTVETTLTDGDRSLMTLSKPVAIQ